MLFQFVAVVFCICTCCCHKETVKLSLKVDAASAKAHGLQDSLCEAERHMGNGCRFMAPVIFLDHDESVSHYSQAPKMPGKRCKRNYAGRVPLVHW